MYNAGKGPIIISHQRNLERDMNEAQKKQLLDAFQDWTGGWTPDEAADQIGPFVASALPTDVGVTEVDAYNFLIEEASK
jgi:hypothetical protein